MNLQVKNQINSLTAQIKVKFARLRHLETTIESNRTESNELREQLWKLREERGVYKTRLYNAACKGLRFPRIKTPKEVRSYVRSTDGVGTISKQSRDFRSVMYYDGNQWIYRVFGVRCMPDKSDKKKGKRLDGTRKIFYPPIITDVFEVYREYEDGRVFKSWRIYTAAFYVTFDCSPKFIPFRSGAPELTDRRWICRYGFQHIFNQTDDEAVPQKFVNDISRSYDPIRLIRLYKKYRLCRHLWSIGETTLAFDGAVLRNVHGKRMMLFKNWWSQSEASQYFYFKPQSYKDIKKYVFDNYTNQFEIFYKEMFNGQDRRMARYLFKNKMSNSSYYNDYINMLNDAGYIITPSLRYPKNLRSAHDAMVAHKNHYELEALRLEKSATMAKMPRYPEFADESHGILVKPFSSTSDFIEYGNYLSHCYKSTTSYWKEVFENNAVMYALCDLVTREPLAVATYSFESKKVVYNLGMRNSSVSDVVAKMANDYAKMFLGKRTCVYR